MSTCVCPTRYRIVGPCTRALTAVLLAGAAWLPPLQTQAAVRAGISLTPLFRVSLPAAADGSPAYRSGVVTAHGTQDLLFVTTRDGRILALNARTGALVWQHQNGPGTCRINNGSTPCYTTSSPAVDPDGRFVYSYGLDGQVYRYRAGSGAEVAGGGWPERVTRKPFDEKGSSALAVATVKDGRSYLYVANGGYPGDQGDYQGHLTTIDLASGAQHVFNAVCSNQPVHFVERSGTPDCPTVQAAIWARQGAVYDPATDRLYVATGNGVFDAGRHAWGDSVLALHPDGTGNGGDPLDSYTPADYARLAETDADLGSSEPVMLPMPSSSTVRHVAVQAGKDGLLRLLNLDNLSGRGAIGHTGGAIGPVVIVPQGGPVLSVPATWRDPTTQQLWVFVANALGISGLRLSIETGLPRLSAVWKNTRPGFSPVVVNNVLLYAGPSGFWALDPRTGAVLAHDSTIGYIHWQWPLIAGSRVYLEDSSAQLTAYRSP